MLLCFILLWLVAVNCHTGFDYNICIISKVRSLSEFTTCNFVEWIEYHLALGVDHFYISNECSPEPHFLPILEYYSRLRLVDNTAHGRKCTTYVPNEFATQKKTFKSYASKHCKWVMPLDMDEFVNIQAVQPHLNTTEQNASYIADIPDITSLQHFVQVYGYPFARLPWWVIGSDNHETRPRGFTIDNYRHGFLHNEPIKTLVKSDTVKDFISPHHPQLKSGLGSKTLYGKVTWGEYIAKRTTLFPHESVNVEVFAPHFENVTRNRANNAAPKLVTVAQPANRLFIKHYMYLSYEEYAAQRAAYNTTAANDANPWSLNPRATWSTGGYAEGKKYVNSINEDFTRHMSVKLNVSIAARVKEVRQRNSTHTHIFDICVQKMW